MFNVVPALKLKQLNKVIFYKHTKSVKFDAVPDGILVLTLANCSEIFEVRL